MSRSFSLLALRTGGGIILSIIIIDNGNKAIYIKEKGWETIKNMLKPSNKEKGFTIIEVVLVLAIAGLIFLVVFLAIPALQKSQRDSARKQDVAKIIAGIQQYIVDTNKRSYLAGAAYTSYINRIKLAQLTTVYTRSTETCQSYGSTELELLVIQPGCKCSNNNTGAHADYTVYYGSITIGLESKVTYCQDF